MKAYILVLLVSLSSLAFAGHPAQSNNLCGVDLIDTTGKGGDLFPWSLAKPFEWSNIQGVWSPFEKSEHNLTFSFQVTRTTNSINQLFVEIKGDARGSQNVARGIGFISNTEKNVMRVIVGDKMLKFGFFKTADLSIESAICGNKILAVSAYSLNECEDGKCDEAPEFEYLEKSSIMLKKISSKKSSRN